MGQLSVWVGGLRVGLWVNVARNLRLKAVTYPDLGFEVTSVLDRLPDIGRGRRARFEGGQRRGLRVTRSCVRGWAATGSLAGGHLEGCLDLSAVKSWPC